MTKVFFDVVTLSVSDHIATVTMQDRKHKNMFSDSLLSGLKSVFKEIEYDESIKVVILRGYENYFCCGGTSKELMDIHESKYDFTELGVHDILLRCPVPVISAMQGHALGGGFVFGCFADVVLLDKRAYYSTNFMNFGFTPGFGSTLIIPKLFGRSLGNEMLFSGKKYAGGDLKSRGADVTVLEKDMLLREAMNIASEMADKPRISLVTLKAHLTKNIINELNDVVASELIMHGATFHRPEVSQRITSYLGGEQ